MIEKINRVRGTRDILDCSQIGALYRIIQDYLASCNYAQIYTPLIEPVALFKRSLGLETDVVSKEMFLVKSSSQESESHEDICLRPEATASMVRAFVENGIQVTPWKVFLIGEMFRYERPQKGRYRQFYQCSIEEIGSESVISDIAFIGMLVNFFSQKVQIAYELQVNYLGCPEDRVRFRQELHDFLQERNTSICQTCQKRKEHNILRVFDCKQVSCQEIYTHAPELIQSLCVSCTSEWGLVQEGLAQLSIMYTHNPRLVRGLDYYNKTVFEFTSELLGAQAAFCGGGRYDHLVSALGGKKDQPSLGAAIGIDRILMILEAMEKDLVTQKKPVFVIIPLSQEQQIAALQLAVYLRNRGFVIDVLYDGSLKSLMRKADSLQARVCMLIGSDEMATGTVSVKDMVTGQSTMLAQQELIEFLEKFL